MLNKTKEMERKYSLRQLNHVLEDLRDAERYLWLYDSSQISSVSKTRARINLVIREVNILKEKELYYINRKES